MIFQVFHSEPPDFFAQRDLMEFPHGFVHVASVEAVSIDEVFYLTNSIDIPWHQHDGVSAYKETRSTSVGDVVVSQDGRHYRCERIGWTRFEL